MSTLHCSSVSAIIPNWLSELVKDFQRPRCASILLWEILYTMCLSVSSLWLQWWAVNIQRCWGECRVTGLTQKGSSKSPTIDVNCSSQPGAALWLQFNWENWRVSQTGCSFPSFPVSAFFHNWLALSNNFTQTIWHESTGDRGDSVRGKEKTLWGTFKRAGMKICLQFPRW